MQNIRKSKNTPKKKRSKEEAGIYIVVESYIVNILNTRESYQGFKDQQENQRQESLDQQPPKNPCGNRCS